MSIEDDARSGRPKEAVPDDENIKKVHNIILKVRKVGNTAFGNKVRKLKPGHGH
jgi:hypothetical protein